MSQTPSTANVSKNERQNVVAENSPVTQKRRLASIDVYRGLVMFLMLAEMLHLYSLAENFPDSPLIGFFEFLRFHTTHVEWVGCSLHDLIQPGFTFLVGVSLPFSLASRQRAGQSFWLMALHALWRSVLLVFLGIFLRSLGADQTQFRFDDTLTQIGLGYTLLFLIGWLPRWVHYVSILTVLAVSWAIFAASTPPPDDFDYAAVGVPAEWSEHEEGFQSRWNKNSNIAWRADVWIMNLFPRDEPFEFQSGGYATINALPTLATMLFGLLAGAWLRDIEGFWPRIMRFASAIILCLLCGWGIAELGICPLVKRIWTPAFGLWSSGWCFLFLLVLHLICDVKGWSRWAFPLLVIGSNSILIYVMSWTVEEPIREALKRHLGTTGIFTILGADVAPVLYGLATLVIMWFVLLFLYRRNVFIRI
jgi:predicted acyltransferase